MEVSRKLFTGGWPRNDAGAKAVLKKFFEQFGEVAWWETDMLMRSGYAFVVYYNINAARNAHNAAADHNYTVQYYDTKKDEKRNRERLLHVDDAAVAVSSSAEIALTPLVILSAMEKQFGPVSSITPPDHKTGESIVCFYDVRHARSARAMRSIKLDNFPGTVSLKAPPPPLPVLACNRNRSRSRSPPVSLSRSKRTRTRSRSRSRSHSRSRSRYNRRREKTPSPPRPPPAPAQPAPPSVLNELLKQNQYLKQMLYESQQRPPPMQIAAGPTITPQAMSTLMSLLTQAAQAQRK